MNLNIEKEYKILLNEQQFNTLANYYSLQYVNQINTYYDNKTHSIRDHKCAMRIRTRQDTYIFTLKAPTKDGDKFEFETFVDKDDASVFETNLSIKELLDEKGFVGPFYKLSTTSTNRAVVNTGYAELCFDITSYEDGSFDYEIEYEYIKDHDGLTVFNEILSQINVVYTKNAPSKIKRALDKVAGK